MPGFRDQGFSAVRTFEPIPNTMKLLGMLRKYWSTNFHKSQCLRLCLVRDCLFYQPFINMEPFPLRLARGKDDKKNADMYIARLRRKIVVEAAAEAWDSGVPWEEAFELASRAVDKAQKIMQPIPPKNKLLRPKAKARPRS